MGFNSSPAEAGTQAVGVAVQDALAGERSHVRGLRDADPLAKQANPGHEPIGLALSGGGIRSATLCLGALQALAESRLLRRFDYLSTVSGGGYIGAWFSAILRRRHAAGVADPIGDVETLLSPSEIRKKDVEPAEIAFLRAYSNYLTPRIGLFSADTLAAVTGYLRNLLLSMLLAVCSTGLVLALLHGLVALVALLNRHPEQLDALGTAAGMLLAASAFFAALLLTLQSANLPEPKDGEQIIDAVLKLLHRAQDLFGRFMMPLVALGLLLLGVVVEASRPFKVGGELVLVSALFGLVSVGLGTAAANALVDESRGVRDASQLPQAVIGLLDVLRKPFDRLLELALQQWRATLRYLFATAACTLVAYKLIVWCGTLAPAHPAVAVLRGPAAMVAIGCLVCVIWLGIVGTTYSELTREWVSRLLGTLVGLTLAWIIVGAVLLHARPAMHWVGTGRWLVALQAAWFLPVAAALLLGTVFLQRRPASEGPGRLARLAVPLGCGLVTLLFMVAMTVGFQEALAGTAGAHALSDIGERDYADQFAAHLVDLHQALQWQGELPASLDAEDPAVRAWAWCRSLWGAMPVLSLLFAALLATSAAFAYIDVNVFSLQNLYRNRLVRCYLGAARHDERLQNPYAGFDPSDDLALASLSAQRPYPLINTALNITQGDELAWQQRKAASFCLSPLWSGYWLESPALARPGFDTRTKGGYVPTASFASEPAGGGAPAGVMLGTAMATSGAAVSSQMGFASRGLLAFVLTLFNVRLGRWFPNTRQGASASVLARHSPRYAGAWYLSELLGRTNEKSPWVYLSDGGHFDNLGVYELVRRRCRLIVAVDAGADPGMSFDDLGNCVRKCRVDFGVNIRLDLNEFKLEGDPPRPAASHVVGKVYYPSVADQPQFVGEIVYIKSSLPRTAEPLPADIVSFHAANPQFPHQSTTDQWFTEAQFESYRQLGYWITKRALPSMLDMLDRIQHAK